MYKRQAYIIAPNGLQVGAVLMNGPEAEIKLGNCLPLAQIPVGTMVHNVELHPGKGGQLVRSAGNAAQLMAKEGKYATLRLPSGDMRLVPIQARATVGQVGNIDHEQMCIRDRRYTIFVQGCPHGCPECHNPQTHSFEENKRVTLGQLMSEIKEHPLLYGCLLYTSIWQLKMR